MEAVLTNETFIVFAGMTLMFVTPWIAYYWHKVRVTEVNAALKAEMVRRGMSAEEILAVLEAPAPGKAGGAGEEARLPLALGRGAGSSGPAARKQSTPGHRRPRAVPSSAPS